MSKSVYKDEAYAIGTLREKIKEINDTEPTGVIVKNIVDCLYHFEVWSGLSSVRLLSDALDPLIKMECE